MTKKSEVTESRPKNRCVSNKVKLNAPCGRCVPRTCASSASRSIQTTAASLSFRRPTQRQSEGGQHDHFPIFGEVKASTLTPEVKHEKGTSMANEHEKTCIIDRAPPCAALWHLALP